MEVLFRLTKEGCEEAIHMQEAQIRVVVSYIPEESKER